MFAAIGQVELVIRSGISTYDILETMNLVFGDADFTLIDSRCFRAMLKSKSSGIFRKLCECAFFADGEIT